MLRPLFALLVVVLATLFTGCASTQDSKEQERVSSIPWNRPERWEGAGPLGGMMNSQ